MTPEQRASIRIVTGDGARWIDSSVAGYCPNAERVPDSFHIVSWMTDCLDRVRKRLRNQARRGNDKTATEAMRGVRYAAPKNPEDLTERQDTDPRGQPYRSWQLKELPRTLPHQPVGQAGAGLERWIFRASHSRIPEIVELCRETRRRKDDIPKTIRPGHSNARPEAFNNKIKATIRMAYGFHHVDNLIALTMAPIRRTRHAPTTTRNLTHENSISLTFSGDVHWSNYVFFRDMSSFVDC